MFVQCLCKFATIVFISHAFGMQFKFNDIHIFFSFLSRPTDPKFLTGWPEKQINLEWPKSSSMLEDPILW